MLTSKALILAAGIGSRLRPLTDRLPKCLVPIAGRPILEYWTAALTDAGVRDVLINTHHLPDQVRQFIASVNRREVLRIHEAYEPELLGSAGTISANAGFADGCEAVIVIYSDNLSDVDLGAMLRFHESHGDPITMLLFHAPVPSACGIATLDDDGRVIAFEEKPQRPSSDLANAGVYVFSASAWREIVETGAFDLGREVLPRFVGRMRGWTGTKYHLDVGTHAAYDRANVDALGLLKRRGYAEDGLRPAVFLDRDGTIIEDVPYLTDPAKVKLVSGACDGLRFLRYAGFACVLVTNQSAIGRGLLTPDGLLKVHDEMLRQLKAGGAVLDGIYYCPIAPKTSQRNVVEHLDRKPGPGMLRTAAEDLLIDLRRSWMIGDMVSDLLAGLNAGCAGSIAVGPNSRDVSRAAGAGPFYSASDFLTAADLIACRERTE